MALQKLISNYVKKLDEKFNDKDLRNLSDDDLSNYLELQQNKKQKTITSMFYII